MDEFFHHFSSNPWKEKKIIYQIVLSSIRLWTLALIPAWEIWVKWLVFNWAKQLIMPYNLFTDECSLNNGGCSNHCSVVPGRGIVCSCPEGLQLNKDNKTCEIIDYCSSHLKCSQVCEQHKHVVKCSCYEGWRLDVDGESCTSVGKQIWLCNV